MSDNSRYQGLGVAEAPAVLHCPSTEQGLLARWEPDVLRAARHRAALVRRPDEAADFAQAARLQLVLASRRVEDAPVGYMRNVIANAVRAAAERLPRRTYPDDEAIAVMESPARDPDAFDAIDAVTRWTAQLSPALRAIYVALYREGRTQRDAGRCLNLSQGRVSQLRQALLALGRGALERFAA